MMAMVLMVFSHSFLRAQEQANREIHGSRSPNYVSLLVQNCKRMLLLQCVLSVAACFRTAMSNERCRMKDETLVLRGGIYKLDGHKRTSRPPQWHSFLMFFSSFDGVARSKAYLN